MIYITGATGHIGNNLVRLLLQRNIPFRLLQRKSGKALFNLPIESIEGDIFDHTFLESHIVKGDILVHIAGLIDLSNHQKEQSDRINHLGTKTIVDFCQKNAVRLIFTSSVDCIYREKKASIIQEPVNIYPEKLKSNYAISKAKGTKYLLDKILHENMDAVILYPSAVIGIHDYKPSAAGKEIQSAMKKRIFFTLHGGYNFIDVQDCAKAILTTIEKPITGSYILAGHNRTISEFYHEINSLSKRNGLYLPVPGWLAKMFVFLIPRFSSMMIDAILDNYHYDNQEMLKDLIPELTPFHQTVAETLAWFRLHPQP